MKDRLLRKLPLHRSSIKFVYNPNLYITDWKDFNNGDIDISGGCRECVKSVHLINKKNIKVYFDGFKENALPKRKGLYNKQCECAVFPINSDTKEWVLFVETKYANNLRAALNPAYDYPRCMVKQIKETVAYFREYEIISSSKVVNAIVSFPNLIEDFNSWIFQNSDETELDILLNYKIIIRGTNTAEIVDDINIYLLSD